MAYYPPEVAWTTIVNDVVLLTPTTYRVTVYPLNVNEPGAATADVQVGYYLKDFIGVSYLVTAINVGGDPTRIEVTDSLNTGYGPQTGQFGYIYKSVGDGYAPFLAPIRYQRIDDSALDQSRMVELDVIWKNLLRLDQTEVQTIINGIPLLEATRVIDQNNELVDKLYADTVNHNGLSGLQGGSTNEYYHLTSAEYTGSGTGVFARVLNPTFTATTGTQPFTVGSTTVVANLNADLLDGQHGSYYLPAYFSSDIQRLGFIYPYETTISFDGTSVFTLAPTVTTWSYWRQGAKRTITGSKSITVASPMVDNTLYYIYIDANDGTLSSSTSAWDLLDDKVQVATLYWNNTQTPKYFLSEERHSCLIDKRMHFYEHFNEGTRIRVLGALTGYTLNSDVNANKTFAIGASEINDEDLRIEVAALTQPDGATASYNVIYRTGATTRNWKSSNMPFVYNVGNTNNVIQYDNGGTMTDCTTGNGANTRWVNSYLCFSNVAGSWRHFIIPGRAQFTSLADAQSEDPTTFVLSGFVSNEFFVAYQLTWTTINSSSQGQCRLAANPKPVKSNLIQSSGISVGFSHNSLSGLQGGTINEYFHLTSAEYVGSGTGVFARVTSPVFTTPNIGNATGSISGNAGTVTNGVYTTDTGTVTNTMLAGSIANNKLSNSTISGVALGSNLFALTIGTGLSGTSYNGSSAITINCTITQYTDALARAAISETVAGLDYNSSTGVFSLTSGYVIPTTTEETNWNAAYSAMHNAVTLATDSGLQISTQVLNMGTPSTITLATTNSVTTSTHTHALSGVAPDSGSANYIQNQNSGAQTANFRISGSGTFGEGITATGAIYANRGESDVVYFDGSNSTGFISTPSAYFVMRQGTDHSFNIDSYNGGSFLNAFKLSQAGNATFVGNVDLNSINPFLNLNSTTGSHAQLRFYNNGTYKGGIYKDASDNIVVNSTGGHILLNGGNVAIGDTTAYGYKLYVNGNFYVVGTGTFTSTVTGTYFRANAGVVGSSTLGYLDLFGDYEANYALRLYDTGKVTVGGDMDIGSNKILLASVSALGTTFQQQIQSSATTGSRFYAMETTRSAVQSGSLDRPDIWCVTNASNATKGYGLRLGRSLYLTDIQIGNGDIRDTADNEGDGNGIPKTPYIRFVGYGAGVLVADSNGVMSSVQTFSISSTITASNFILSSDERRKVDIKPIDNLERFSDIRWVNFKMANDDMHMLRTGVIAQDVEKIAPELVYINQDGEKSVAYIDLLCSKIALLESKIAYLENRHK